MLLVNRSHGHGRVHVPASSRFASQHGVCETFASPQLRAKEVGGGSVGRKRTANRAAEVAFSVKCGGAHLISVGIVAGPSAASGVIATIARTVSGLPQY
jgi:hypothetical protein